MRLEIILVILLLIRPNRTSTTTKEKCEAISNSKFYGDSCLVAIFSGKNHNDAKSSCTHFSNGHLALVLTEKTLNAIQQLTGKFINEIGHTHCDCGENVIPQLTAGYGSSWFAIGLFQVNKTVEPDAGWAWILPDGQQWIVPDKRLLLWSANELNSGGNIEHAGYYVGDGLRDGNEVVGTYYICEYEQRQKMYKLGAENQIGDNATFLGESYAKDLLSCSMKCAQVLVCRAFSYKQGDHQCILHWTTSDGISAMPPVQSEGYEMFDSQY